MRQPSASARHLDTVAALDIIAGVSLAGVVIWLVGGLSFAVDEAERGLRLKSAGVVGPLSLLLIGLGAAVLRRVRVASRLQRWLALVVLPLAPVGTVWGWYTLRVLRRPDAQAEFEAREPWSGPHRPFWGPVSLATALGVACLSFGVLKARELWLERQVARAAEAVSEQQEAVSRRIEELRENGVVDTGSPQPHRIRR